MGGGRGEFWGGGETFIKYTTIFEENVYYKLFF